jgi:hypothetical protein
MTRVPDLSQFVKSTHWGCPNCNIKDVTREAQPHTRYHDCPGLRGLSAPMVAEGDTVRITVVEPEDYVSGRIKQGEAIPTDENGRPVAAVVTERPDGSNDVAVFAGCATPSGRASG